MVASLIASTRSLRRARLLLGWVTGQTTSVFNQPSGPTQLPTLYEMESEYRRNRPRCDDALRLVSKGMVAHSIYVDPR